MSSSLFPLVVGVVVGLGLVPLAVVLFKLLTVSVEDEETVLVTRFGKLVATLSTPGLHVLPGRVLPWVALHRVSQRRDFRHFRNVHVNDARGTTVIVDLWLEFRVTDAAKALFSVADYSRSLQNLVAHAATSILGTREFKQILRDRTELGELLQGDIAQETARWGLTIELVFLRNVSLLPEVSRQLFETVAARLERAKADVEEVGRLAVAELEAETQKRVATLVADAKGQYPAAVGRALAALRTNGPVFDAYNELYELSLVRPHRTVTFRGFEPGEMRAADAAMIVPGENGAAGPLPALPARIDAIARR